MPNLDELDSSRQDLGMSVCDLWVGYCGVGGNASQAQVASWLGGRAIVSAIDFDLLVQAVNDWAAGCGLTFPVHYLDGS
jgi:hypothetical protein